MPIIVDEVVISVEVGNAAAGGASTPPSGTADRHGIVAEAVERVLDILARKAEP
jgi:hypothetical protein